MDKQIIFHEIYDYYYQPFTQTLTFKLLVGAGVLLLIALITFLIMRRRRRESPAWQWALQVIDKLNLADCKTRNDYKRFYFMLTEIIKQYLNRRYAWKTTNKTDDELIIYLKDQRFETTLLDALKKMLTGAVWIKFAGEDVIKTQAEKDFDIAKTIIQQTTPQE